MTAARPGPNNANEPRQGGRRPPQRGAWMVDVATRRVFRAAPPADLRDAPMAEEDEAREGDQA